MSTIVNLKEVKKWLIKKSLYEFVKEMWDSYEPLEYVDSWLIEYLCECYEYSIKHFLPNYCWGWWISDKEYEEIKKKTGGVCPVRDFLLPDGSCARNHDLNIAPRHTKSTIFNVLGPAWTIINTPISVVSVSHSIKLSGEMVEKKQKLFSSDKYKYYFEDEFKLQPKKNTADHIELMNGGKTYSISMDKFTGFGGDLIINDDLISVAEARRDGAALLHARDYFKTTMPSRLNNKKTGVIWHIMQRIGKGDISDLIAEDKGLRQIYSHTEMQAISDHEITFIYPCSGKIKKISKGDLLWEERFGDYSQLKMEIGQEDFEAQYNQRPSKNRLNVIKDEYIHWIEDNDYEEFKLSAEFHYGSHDCPVKDKETSDFHGFCEAESRGNELVIADAFEEHLSYIKEKELMTSLQKIDPAIIQIVEDKANGAALLQDLYSDVSGLVAFNPGTKSKMQRLELASIYMQQGLVRFRRTEKTEELIVHLKKFPLLVHDDMVDAFSQLVIYHFTQRHLGVYSGSFNYENITKDKMEDCFYTYGATVSGDKIKVIELSINNREDKYIVSGEWVFYELPEFEEFCRGLKPGSSVYDASPKNRLSGLVTQVYNILKFNDKDRDKSISILKAGFLKKKVLVNKDCKQTINDIARMRFTDAGRERGIDSTETFDEGMSGCVRAVITSIKGYSHVWY